MCLISELLSLLRAPGQAQAIDLVDEAAAKLKMEITSKPEALDVIDRQVKKMHLGRRDV